MPKPKGKKITSIPVSSPTRKQMVDIYLDTHTGRFSARYNGGTFDDLTLEGLRQKLSDATNVDFDCVWTPYLYYGVDTGSQDGGWIKLGFWYRLILVSEPLNEKRYVRDAWVDTDGQVIPEECRYAHVFEQNGALIPYSPERLAFMKGISKAVKETGAALSKLVLVSSEEAAKWIDEQSLGGPATRLLRSAAATE